MGKKAAIIGAGIGGIATGILLSKKGFEVEIFEKNSFAGGRCSGFVKDGHRFDAGATMLMMPEVFKDLYSAFGKDFSKEIEIFRMDPTYRVWFSNQVRIDFSSDLVKLKPQFEAIEKGSYFNFLKYLKDSAVAFDLAMKYFIRRNFNTVFDMLNFRNLFLFPKINAHKSYYNSVNRYFKNEFLRHIFTLQSLYLGLNPARTPGVFFSLPEMELSEGVWFPKGGMKQITENLLSIAAENRIKINLNSPVKKIKCEKNHAAGFFLEDETFHEADVLVVNADLPYVYKNLLPENQYTKRIFKKEFTCSALVFHWGVDTLFPQLEQHNVFISRQHKEYLKSVFNRGEFPEDPTFYLHSPARTDKTAAPEGNDSITVIIPIANLKNKSFTVEKIKEKAKKGIINRLAQAGITDFEKHIKFEMIYTPENWSDTFNLTYGSTFGSLSHRLMQMGYFRPHNRHRKFRNVFFTGGSTHPGNGVPMTLISAGLTTEKILQSSNIQTE